MDPLGSAMAGSVGSRFGDAGYTWSPLGKDRDGDGAVTRKEFKLPVMPGSVAGSLTPADLRTMPSLDEAFDAYDRNRDGKIDGEEAKANPQFKSGETCRFSGNWADSMTTEQALAYFRVVDQDNARLVKQWGIEL